MGLEDILGQVGDFACRLVEITGGEPLLQPETPMLIEKLLDHGFQVLLETNGSFDIGQVDGRCVKILDVKCPGSRMADRMDLENLGRLGHGDQLKFVIMDRTDYEYARTLTNSVAGGKIGGDRILFSPVAGCLHPAVLAEWILADRLDVRFQLQLHKVLWPNIERGV